jgi:hypothetical protein
MIPQAMTAVRYLDMTGSLSCLGAYPLVGVVVTWPTRTGSLIFSVEYRLSLSEQQLSHHIPIGLDSQLLHL